MNDAPQFLSARDAAKRLGYEERRVRQLCELGRIPGALQLGPGSKWRIPVATVEQLEQPRQRPSVIRRSKMESSAPPAPAE